MKPYAFGVDVGGETVKLGLFSADGTLLEKWEVPTRRERDGESILPDVAASVKGRMERAAACAPAMWRGSAWVCPGRCWPTGPWCGA
jgi:predicted NBD/HSP70 family sugar kinase